MKRKDIVLIFALFVILLLLFVLFINKSFFRDYYVDSNKNKIYVPRFSYFLNENSDYISFYSLRYEEDIDNSIKDFINNCNDCGYNTTLNYKIKNDGLFRRIIIEY